MKLFFLKDKLGLETKISNDISSVPTSNAITLRLKDTKDDHSLSSSYKLSVNPEIPSISVEASDPSGAFYGIQSLLALLENEKVPTTEIEDYPRFFLPRHASGRVPEFPWKTPDHEAAGHHG